ncbi:hypothetical protein [Streptomyces sp. NBC_00239]|uniref:hypothetical protein n=1 Tax=Streptomyces sp. NBC_00239 TaxID=2903640 RepID=UPI002E28D249|nr:hypothetical protein [Streptomyces sp. NBC_00239]
MRRGLVHALAWTLATGAAMTLSWWGVHSVMSGTAYDPPRALPLSSDPQASSTWRAAAPSRSPSPVPSGTPSAGPSATPSPPARSTAPAQDPEPAGSRRPLARHDDGAGRDSGRVESRTVDGGRVAFDLGTSSARLLSATPAAGWRIQVWKQDFWIRVTFTRDDREVNVFCTWHDHAPTIEIDER